jgi:hypothetical protein
MERSAHEGNDADMLSYRLYHLIRLDNFVTADIQRLLDEPHEAVKYPDPEIPYVKPAPVAAEAVHDEAETLSDATSISEKKNFPLIPLITAASGLLILLIPAGILHIPRSFRLGGMALFMTSLILLLFSLRKKTKVSPGNIKEKTDTTADETGEYDTYFSNTVSPLSDVSDDRLGRTVFIESDPKDIEGLLIEKNRKNEYPLTSFPFTIGKLKDRCELELNDRSVSRIHARILKKDDQYYLQDCGSTNGTFLNGIQLQAEETVPIEKDDEIGIGRVRFVLA